MTCLYDEEWQQIVQAREAFIRSKLGRLADRYGCGKYDGIDWLEGLVRTRRWQKRDEGYVLINGVSQYVEEDRLEYIRKMWAIHGKLPA